MKADRTLDCIGLFCPMPIIKTKQELETMKSGEILEIFADDPGFEKDLFHWCQMTGNECLGIEKEGNVIKGYVKKK
ncbi:MAG: sulfurtransferase TusA family protein [candidate division WOR-3 bacterium]|nr:sulfurtransferase TusA family protein [candidate division WOR-3 bacterium]